MTQGTKKTLSHHISTSKRESSYIHISISDKLDQYYSALHVSHFKDPHTTPFITYVLPTRDCLTY